MTSESKDGGRVVSLDDFHPFFQPIVALRTGQRRGYELLARLDHPQRGWLLPESFISEAENDGWIDALTWELLGKAFAATAAMPHPLALAVNISPIQLRNAELPEQIQRIADASHFPLHRLTVEITESALTSDLVQARLIAHDLKRRGCRLALDDFGTGYSSLSHLEALPFDAVKVDRSFISAMTRKRSSRKIVAAVVGLGQSLGLTTIAEGVETREEADMLQWLGCDLAQGWLYGEAISADDLRAQQLSEGGFTPEAKSTSDLARKSLENLPAQRLAQLQALYDGAPVGLAFLDRNQRYVSINRRLADLNGHPIEAHLGRTVNEMIPEVYPWVEPYIRRALNGESILGVELTKPASGPNPDSSILLSYEPALDEAGEVIGVSVALVDITSLKRAERARQETEEHLRHMMELIPQIPWVIDPEGRALDVSQRWLDLTGMKEDEWRGFGWLDALHPDDRQPTLDVIRGSLRTGGPIDVVYRVRRPNGDWTPMHSRGSARVGEDGRIMCWYGCIEELDEANPRRAGGR
jgi:PAS domain S-box-containing protein